MKPPTTLRGMRDYIRSISPPWLTAGTDPNLPGTSGRLMYDIGLLGDNLIEKLNQALFARMPGIGTATANPLIGNDRVLVQAPGETAAQFSLRLTNAFDTWDYAGNDKSVLQQVVTYCAPYVPLTRVVSNSGSWSWYAAGDTNYLNEAPIHYQINNWTWDSLKNPLTLDPAWWRDWLMIFPGLTIAGSIDAASNATPIEIHTTTNHGLVTGNQVCITGALGNVAANGYWTVTQVDSRNFTLNTSVGSGAYTQGGTAYLVPATALETVNSQVVGPAPFVFGSPGITIGGQPNASIGLNVPPSWFTPIQQLLQTWKAANVWYPYIMIVFEDGAAEGDFSPWTSGQPSGGTAPPGQWGTWAINVGGVLVAARNDNVRYVKGVP